MFLFPAIKLGEKRNIKVITKSAGKSNGPAKVTMTTPSKKRFEIPVRVSSDGYEGQLVPTEIGPHKIDVTYGSSVVPKSPFTVNVTPGADLGKVKVTGLDTRKLYMWFCRIVCFYMLCKHLVKCSLFFIHFDCLFCKCFVFFTLSSLS